MGFFRVSTVMGRGPIYRIIRILVGAIKPESGDFADLPTMADATVASSRKLGKMSRFLPGGAQSERPTAAMHLGREATKHIEVSSTRGSLLAPDRQKNEQAKYTSAAG
jgi:hypothetical protein